MLKWGDSYDGHGEMYYDYNHGPSYKHHDTYHEPHHDTYHGKADDKPTVYKPENPIVYKPEPTYQWCKQTSSTFSKYHESSNFLILQKYKNYQYYLAYSVEELTIYILFRL